MRRLIVLLIFIPFVSFSQTDTTRSSRDGKWIYYGKDRPDSQDSSPLPPLPAAIASQFKGGSISPCTGYHVEYGRDPETGDSVKRREGNYVNDAKEGKWIFYYSDGITPSSIYHFNKNSKQGPYQLFYRNGVLKETGTYKGCDFLQRYCTHIDSIKRYDLNGVLISEVWYDDQGTEQGQVRFFYPNGQLQYSYFSQNGKVKGTARRYYENGDIKEELDFDEDGDPIGLPREYQMINPSHKQEPATTRK